MKGGERRKSGGGVGWGEIEAEYSWSMYNLLKSRVGGGVGVR